MSRVRDGLLGFAIGDAMGVPVEFTDRVRLLDNPVVDMQGFGTYDVPAGSWSDDTSMTIATMDSIIKKHEIDYFDIMMNFYYWLKESRFTSTGYVFDAGHTCVKAVINFSNTLDIENSGSKEIDSNGNGSLMRMLPIVFYCYYKKPKVEEIYTLVKESSSLTHGHEISIMGCYIYVRFLLNILNGKTKQESYNSIKRLKYDKYFTDLTINYYRRILKQDISKLKLEEIRSSGFIVDTLEAVMFDVLNTNKYTESIIGAVNLGGDTDTIAAIAGSITGILYGCEEIPEKWLDKLQRREYLENIADTFESEMLSETELKRYNYFNIRFNAAHNNAYLNKLLDSGINIEDKYLNKKEFYEIYDVIKNNVDNQELLDGIYDYIKDIEKKDDLNELLQGINKNEENS